MDRQMIDARVRDLNAHLREAERSLQPHAFLLDCVAAAGRIAAEVPAELRAHLASRLDPVLSRYALDAARVLRARSAVAAPTATGGESSIDPLRLP
jgi:hypothetical protein